MNAGARRAILLAKATVQCQPGIECQQMADEGPYYRFPGFLNVRPRKMGTRLRGTSPHIDRADIAVRLDLTVVAGPVMALNAANTSGGS
jgi:hypothetical protein